MNDANCAADLKLDQNISQYPDKDFVINYWNSGFNIPKCILGKSEKADKYCAMVTFVPNFANLSVDDAQK